jgi:putative ABC transport system permease protein
MSITRLVLNEIRHRKLNFILALLSVTIAVGCLTGAQTLLRSDEVQTDDILSAKKVEVEKAVAARVETVEKAGKEHEDFVRKQMLKLGFNILILPEKQDLSELHLDGRLTETMPEEYVDRLAKSTVMTVNHLLPSVVKRVDGEHGEQKHNVVLQGTRGEVPILNRGLKKMLLAAVPPGKAVIGSEVQKKFELEKGDTLTILGKDFEVTTINKQVGSIDDVTVWIDLKQAQRLLGMENLINAILALECGCAGDRLAQIRAEVGELLPGTQIIEEEAKALARAESRLKAKVVAEKALTDEKTAGAAALKRAEKTRVDIENRHAGLAGVLVPLVMLGCAVWIGFLAFGNVRQRQSEIGILRAIGLSSKQILALFLSRSLLTGIVGGLIGCGLGLLIGLQFGAGDAAPISVSRLMESAELKTLIILAPILAPVFSAIACWLPAVMAAKQDPATVLQE